jgi:hypothetical protein
MIPEHEESCAARVGVGVRVKQAPENAANSGDASAERHQHNGGDANKNAADRRGKRCELRNHKPASFLRSIRLSPGVRASRVGEPLKSRGLQSMGNVMFVGER